MKTVVSVEMATTEPIKRLITVTDPSGVSHQRWTNSTHEYYFHCLLDLLGVPHDFEGEDCIFTIPLSSPAHQSPAKTSTYTIDFYLYTLKLFIELKPAYPYNSAVEKCTRLMNSPLYQDRYAKDHRVMIVYGDIKSPESDIHESVDMAESPSARYEHQNGLKVLRIFADGTQNSNYRLCCADSPFSAPSQPENTADTQSAALYVDFLRCKTLFGSPECNHPRLLGAFDQIKDIKDTVETQNQGRRQSTREAVVERELKRRGYHVTPEQFRMLCGNQVLMCEECKHARATELELQSDPCFDQHLTEDDRVTIDTIRSTVAGAQERPRVIAALRGLFFSEQQRRYQGILLGFENSVSSSNAQDSIYKFEQSRILYGKDYSRIPFQFGRFCKDQIGASHQSSTHDSHQAYRYAVYALEFFRLAWDLTRLEIYGMGYNSTAKCSAAHVILFHLASVWRVIKETLQLPLPMETVGLYLSELALECALISDAPKPILASYLAQRDAWKYRRQEIVHLGKNMKIFIKDTGTSPPSDACMDEDERKETSDQQRGGENMEDPPARDYKACACLPHFDEDIPKSSV